MIAAHKGPEILPSYIFKMEQGKEHANQAPHLHGQLYRCRQGTPVLLNRLNGESLSFRLQLSVLLSARRVQRRILLPSPNISIAGSLLGIYSVYCAPRSHHGAWAWGRWPLLPALRFFFF